LNKNATYSLRSSSASFTGFLAGGRGLVRAHSPESSQRKMRIGKGEKGGKTRNAKETSKRMNMRKLCGQGSWIARERDQKPIPPKSFRESEFFR
jgi:hypothetical protein